MGELFGMKDVLGAYLTAAADGLLRARVVGALWWDRERGAEQIPELLERRAEGQVGRFRGQQREDHAGRRGRELHGRDDRPLPRRVRVRDRQRRAQLRRPGRAARLRDRAGRARLPGALPRARRPGGARGARRPRGRTGGQRPHGRPPPPGPPAGRPPRRHPALRPARRGRQHPAVVGGPRAADGRADHPVPRPGPLRRSSTRSPTCCGPGPGWPPAATGRCPAPTRWRASMSPSTGSPRGPKGPRPSRCRRATG